MEVVTVSAYTARQVLGPGGVIAKKLPGYEHRSQQLEMAELIERVVADGGDAVIEAGTGTGKDSSGNRRNREKGLG